MISLSCEQIKKFIPHRAPFLFLDEILNIQLPDTSPFKNQSLDEMLSSGISAKDLIGGVVTAKFTVQPSLNILEGHFPGNPIFPGVTQVEAMAQASCFMIYPLYKQPLEKSIQVLLMGVDGAKFRRPVVPGMTLLIRSELKKVRGQIMSYEASIKDEATQQLISQADLLASLV